MQVAVALKEEPLTLEEILWEELIAFVPGFFSDPRDSPIFWQEVFIRWYGKEPSGDTDPLWDELFKIGYPALRAIRG